MKISTEFHIYTDGAARGNPGKAGAGVVIRDTAGVIAEKSFYLGHTTNNVAKYSALILGLREAQQLGAHAVFPYTDSELLAKQIAGAYRVKDEKLKVLFSAAKRLLSTFIQYDITHIRRENNREADRLANEAIEQVDAAPGRPAAVRIV
jgi:ribonuclease HI